MIVIIYEIASPMQASLTADISYVPFFSALKNSRPSLSRYRIEKQSIKIKIPLTMIVLLL